MFQLDSNGPESAEAVPILDVERFLKEPLNSLIYIYTVSTLGSVGLQLALPGRVLCHLCTVGEDSTSIGVQGEGIMLLYIYIIYSTII